MRDCTPQQLLEIDRCFQYVLEHIETDEVRPRSVFFGSTVDNWFRSSRGECRMRIVVASEPPNDGYERAYLRQTGKQ